MTFHSSPKSWRKVSLSDCCKIISGATPRRDNPEYWGGTIPWVTPKDLSKLEGTTIDDAPEYITEKGYRSCSTDLLPKGAVLFSSRAPIGHVAIAGRPMCTNQGFKSLIPGDELTSSYLYWCLRKLVPEISARGTGTTFKEVSKAVMEEFEIPLPTLPEQKRIAAILDKADSIRRKRQEAVRLTEELLRSVFLDMFGDPVTNPKGWKEIALTDVAEIVSGVTKGRKLSGKKTVLAPYLRVANVQDGYLNLGEIKEIEVLPSDVDKYRLHDGDILLTEGGDPDKLGRGTVWREHVENCIHQNHIFRVRIKTDKLLPDFLSVLIGSERGKRYFLRAAKQTTGIASINSTQLKNFPVLIPSLALQRQFSKIVVSTKKLKRRLSETESTTDALFNSLLQGAFKGGL